MFLKFHVSNTALAPEFTVNLNVDCALLSCHLLLAQFIIMARFECRLNTLAFRAHFPSNLPLILLVLSSVYLIHKRTNTPPPLY